MLECQHQPPRRRRARSRPARDPGQAWHCRPFALTQRNTASPRASDCTKSRLCSNVVVGHGLTPSPGGPSLVRLAVIVCDNRTIRHSGVASWPNERDVVLHSWCVQADWDAPTVVGGQGARLHLEDGREILDMSSLAECSNLGHQHPKLVAAIREQADAALLSSRTPGARAAAALAERLLELSGFEGGRVFFTLGRRRRQRARDQDRAPGAGRAARPRHHARPLLPRRDLPGDGAVGRLTARARRSTPHALGLGHVPPPYAYRCPFGSTDDARVRSTRAAARRRRTHRREGADRVAAVLMEPNAGSNGIVAPDNFWPALRSVTRAARRAV